MTEATTAPVAKRSSPGIGDLVRSALWLAGRSSPRHMAAFARIAWHLWHARRRRRRRQQEIGGPIPTVVAISPTMRCNYDCLGCYSRGRSSDDELSTEELDGLYTEAEDLGIGAVVVTGGEPLLRDDTLDLMASHPRLFFVAITNGSLVTPEIARRMGQSGDVMTLVSIEGFPEDTDTRRRAGAHETAVRALESLRDAHTFFGFAAMNTASNTDHLGSEAFVDQMVKLGCFVGYFTEYVPCGQKARPEWVLDEATRAAFRERVLDLRRRKPIVLIQFPQDEYGEENRCSAAGQQSLHINSQGDIEPCPFVPIARESVRQGGLLAACQSPFLRAIRDNPHLLQREKYACSLFEHRGELDQLAAQLDAEAD